MICWIIEIEHFVDPQDKRHSRFASVKSEILTLFSAEAQLTTGRCVDITVEKAISTGLINNETLGYFMTRTQQWLVRIGVRREKLRFRQHLKTEMAHYAADCWDAEIQMSYGWIECVGHADRACYDLDQHSKRTGIAMQASIRLSQPQTVTRTVAIPNKKLLGPLFKTNQKIVMGLLEALEGDALTQLQSDLSIKGEAELIDNSGTKYNITSDLVTFENETKVIFESKYTPSVIEPSYGIGRILYAVLEHSFSQRTGDEQRCVMAFRPCVAPIKVGIFPLTNFPSFIPIINRLRDMFQKAGVSNRTDASTGTVGRRYSRSDELGIPFGLTVDFRTLLDDSVTVRDRDTMAQVRVPIARVSNLLQQLISETLSWSQVMERFVIEKAAGIEMEEDEEVSSGENTSKVLIPSSSRTIIENLPRARFSRPNPNLSSQ